MADGLERGTSTVCRRAFTWYNIDRTVFPPMHFVPGITPPKYFVKASPISLFNLSKSSRIQITKYQETSITSKTSFGIRLL